AERDIEKLQAAFDKKRDRVIGLGQVLASGIVFIDSEAVPVGQGSRSPVRRSGKSAEAHAKERFPSEFGAQLTQDVSHEPSTVLDRAAIAAGSRLRVQQLTY